MLQATGGVNTHRGAIFAFGLLSTAIGRIRALEEPLEQNLICDHVARMCQHIVARELSSDKDGKLSKGGMHFHIMVWLAHEGKPKAVFVP
jgi:triphosphoribosyl-dephospho-CoA synthase